MPPEHRDYVLPALEQVVEDYERRKRVMDLVQEALSELRVEVKYLMFDLEATRRERDAALESCK